MEFLFLKSVNINIVLSWIIIAILFVRILIKILIIPKNP